MSKVAAGLTHDVLEHLGDQVRKRRRASDLTIQQLADASGLSRRMLGDIELGKANPSLLTVAKLARGLGAEFAALLRPTRVGVLELNRPAGPEIWTSERGSHATLAVASTSRPPVEMWDWVLVSGDVYRAEPDPEGSEEMILVLDGVLSLVLDGVLAGRISAGASARLASDREYSYRNDGSEPVRFVRVAHPAM